MNILYTCDNNYIWIMGISMISLFENNKNVENLDVYLLAENISKENKAALLKIAQNYERKLLVIDVPKFDIPDVLLSQRWPISAFTRLFSGELLPNNLDKILYLDCDTIIKGDISKIEDIDMGNSVFCGVKDCIGRAYKKNLGLLNNDVYVNAGVLYINLIKLRKIDVPMEIEKYLKRYKSYINYADQDILNGIFVNKISILEPSCNIMTIASVYEYDDIIRLRKPTNYYSKVELEKAVSNPIIIHYTTNMLTIRPWFSNTNHPFAQEFMEYFELSPWKDKKLSQFNFVSKESKVIKLLQIIPDIIAFYILGIIHSKLKPLYIKLRANTKRLSNIN